MLLSTQKATCALNQRNASFCFMFTSYRRRTIVPAPGKEYDQEHQPLVWQRSNKVQNNGDRPDGSPGASGGRKRHAARKEPPAEGEMPGTALCMQSLGLGGRPEELDPREIARASTFAKPDALLCCGLMPAAILLQGGFLSTAGFPQDVGIKCECSRPYTPLQINSSHCVSNAQFYSILYTYSCRWLLLEHTSSLAKRRWTTPRITRWDFSTTQRR